MAIVQVTAPDRDQAERIASAMVEARLAACANILGPCTAIYRWQGGIERAEEMLVQFKTAPALIPRLTAGVAAAHPYALPVIEHWEAGVDGAVAAWIAAETA